MQVESAACLLHQRGNARHPLLDCFSLFRPVVDRGLKVVITMLYGGLTRARRGAVVSAHEQQQALGKGDVGTVQYIARP